LSVAHKSHARLRLERLLEAEEDRERAEIAFRTLYRLIHGGPVRPKYPRFDWDYLGYYLANLYEVYKPDAPG
jgi:hypothetical protein